MSKKKICFIAQFPPPMHGLSKAVETLYNSELNQEFEFEKVDITNNKKFLSSLFGISRSKADLFYFTISQTKGGNIRDLVILKLLDMQKKKCLIHLHGGYYRTLVDNLGGWQARANYKAIGKLAGAIVLGPSLKWIFEGMLSEKKIYTVPNCVDDQYLMSEVQFMDKCASYKQKKIKHILYLSNFIRSKGYPEVLEMAKLEKESVDKGNDRKYHFDFAGKFFEKAEEDYFNLFIKNNNLEEYVSYHGVVGGEQKQGLLNNADIFVLLTRYPNEGQPISILEAMGNGLQVITTNHAGIPDIVKDGVTGIVIDKKVEKNIPNNILERIQNEDGCKMILAARNSVIANYQERNYIENMRAVFKKVEGE